MKKFLLIAALSATAFGTSSVMASPTGTTEKNTLGVQEIRDSSLHNTRAAQEVFRTVRGVYALDDGTTLYLYRNSGAFVAEVSGQAPVEVLATKAGTLVAANGAAELKFVRNSGGQVANVVLTKQ